MPPGENTNTMNEITTSELEKIDGGAAFLIPVATGLVIALGAHIINNWDDFLAGLAGNKQP